MTPRLRRLGRGLMNCVAVAWFGYQAVYGEGPMRIASIILLIAGVVLTAATVLDHALPRPKRRRALDKRDAG